MPITKRTAAAFAVAVFSVPAAVRGAPVTIPPGPLGGVAAALGTQFGATIAITDPRIASLRSPGVRGNMPLAAAVGRALRGTGAEAIYYGPSIIRLVRKRMQDTPKPGPLPLSVIPPVVQPEIVVTASKQRQSLDRYPGSALVVPFDPDWIASNATGGTAAITKLAPTLASTNLGPGRDKLFIRGIADSSFNGPSAATVGEYLGDVRMSFNAPDPDLNLYDMKRTEVLVGPQGTLYGAGSLGGVIRFVPNVPDTQDLAVTMTSGLAATQSGGISRDGAGMLNLPLVSDRLAARVVVYGGEDAGYIDDPSRGLHNINSTRRVGQRVSLRAQDLGGWTVDLGFIFQNITDADGQYATRGSPDLSRDNAIAQPFHNDYRLGYVTARRAAGRAEITSTTAVVRHDLKTVFDATGFDGTRAPARFDEENEITLLTHETRIAGGSDRRTWVAGGSLLFSASNLSRALGPLGAETAIPGVVNIHAEAALFGQITHPLTQTLAVTIGGRMTFANATGYVIDKDSQDVQKSTRDVSRFSSTLALDWHPIARFSAFFHYQQGYREGGLAVAPSGSGLISQRFATDSLNMDELGVRIGDEQRDRVSVRAAIFAADWSNIQADLIDGTGLPYTTNIGSGYIVGLDGHLTWRPASDLTFTIAAFTNSSAVSKPAPQFVTPSRQALSNVAKGGARIAGSWRHRLSSDVRLKTDLSARYVGKSYLGVGSLLDIPQGDFLVIDASAQVDFERFALLFDLDNVTNERGNSFSFGNPFEIAQRNQITPLRPRTIRIGFSARF